MGGIAASGCCCTAGTPPPPPGTGGANGSPGDPPPTPAGTPGPTAQQFSGNLPAAAQALKGAGEVKAIDVSNWQGNIDWNAVKGDGVRVAYLKATESKDFKDKSYDRNREEAAKAGIVTGAYDFARPGSQNKGDLVADAQAEAKHFLATANVKAGDLAPALDLEADGGLNKDQLATWVKAWADTVKAATGTTPVIYTSPSFWKGKVGDAAAAGNFRLWIAHWGVNSPDVPTGWQAWSGWQTTSDGHTAGISGRVDQDKVRDPYSLLVGA